MNKVRRNLLNILPVAILVLLSAAHPIHVSVTDVEYVRVKKELQVIVRIFTDDLELQIRNEINDPKLDILNPGSGKTSDDLFRNYLRRHLSFKVNGTARDYTYLGHEEDMGSIVSYLLIENVNSFESLEVMNDILLDTYDDQVNLVHITIGDDIMTMKFTRGEEVQSRRF